MIRKGGIRTTDCVSQACASLRRISPGRRIPELEQARKLYNSTDFEQSLKVLQAIPRRMDRSTS